MPQVTRTRRSVSAHRSRRGWKEGEAGGLVGEEHVWIGEGGRGDRPDRSPVAVH